MNDKDPSIDFTMEYDQDTRSVNYLDIPITINDQGYIETDLYTKPNLKNQLLLPYSAHPPFITKNIVYSLAVRLVRIVSDPAQREVRFKQLADRLRTRYHSPGGIKAGIEKARSLVREDELQEKMKDLKRS